MIGGYSFILTFAGLKASFGYILFGRKLLFAIDFICT